MAAGGIYAGGQITADDIQGVAPLAKYKSSDQSTTSTSVVNDTDLFLNLDANSVYRLMFTPLYTAAAGPDMSVTFAVPSGATFVYNLVHQGGGGTLFLDTGGTSAARMSFRYAGNGSNVQGAIMAGTILTGSAGTFRIQFFQFTSSSTPVVMKQGSELDAWKIA